MRVLESEPESDKSWIIGVLLGTIGSIAINLGNNVQSLGHKKIQAAKQLQQHPFRSRITKVSFLHKEKIFPVIDNDEVEMSSEEMMPISPKVKPQSQQEHIDEKSNEQSSVTKSTSCTSLTWYIGTIIFVTGSLINFISFAFAAQSMLASLESIQFISNLLFGKLILGSEVTRPMLFGTFLTVAGTIFTVQFSSKEKVKLGSDELKLLYSNPIYIAYLCFMGGLLVMLNLIYKHYEKNHQLNTPKKNSGIIMPLTYSIWSAIFGTQSVVQAKVLAELLAVQSKGEENVFQSWFIYFTLSIWILTVSIWLRRLNNALSKFEPVFIIPLIQCSFIVFAIVSGGIFFREFDNFAPLQWLGFWSGILIMLSGLVLLMPSPVKTSSETAIQNEVMDLIKDKNDGNNPSPRCHNRISYVYSSEDAPSFPRPEPSDLLFRKYMEDILTLIKNGCTTSFGASSILSCAITTYDVEQDIETRICENLKRVCSMLTDDSMENGNMGEELNHLFHEIKEQLHQLDDRHKHELKKVFQELDKDNKMKHSLRDFIRSIHLELQKLEEQ